MNLLETVIRFLRDTGFEKASWGTDLVCYSRGKRIARPQIEHQYMLKCRWYELEMLLDQELGMCDPEHPRWFFKDKPAKKPA